MATIYDRKMRGLFVVDADHLFTPEHPLWEIITTFRSDLAEIHVAVFSKQKIFEKDKYIEHDEQLLIYHFRRGNFLFRFKNSIRDLVFHLSWHKEFRPDFVVSFSETEGALAGSLLAQRFEKRFFQHATIHTLGLRRFSFHRLFMKYVLRHAVTLFVPGPESAVSIAKELSLPPAALIPIEPPITLATIEVGKQKHDFHTEHPQYNFFLSTVLYENKLSRTLIEAYQKVALKYPRTALVLFVEESIFEALAAEIKRKKHYGMLVYKKDDNFLSAIAGTHIYLALTREADIDTNMLAALSVEVPVVSIEYGIAKEIFSGSKYSGALIQNPEQAPLAIVRLIEDQRLRAEYALNTKTLFSKLSFNTTEQYAQKMYRFIEEITRPQLPIIETIEEQKPEK